MKSIFAFALAGILLASAASAQEAPTLSAPPPVPQPVSQDAPVSVTLPAWAWGVILTEALPEIAAKRAVPIGQAIANQRDAAVKALQFPEKKD